MRDHTNHSGCAYFPKHAFKQTLRDGMVKGCKAALSHLVQYR